MFVARQMRYDNGPNEKLSLANFEFMLKQSFPPCMKWVRLRGGFFLCACDCNLDVGGAGAARHEAQAETSGEIAAQVDSYMGESRGFFCRSYFQAVPERSRF